MQLFNTVFETSGYAFDDYFCQSGKTIVGIDEAGRGPLAGPVVSAAVVLNYDNKILGLNDSKKLSEKQREALLPVICEKALRIGVGYSFPQEIDEINILQASIVSMKSALLNTGVQGGILLIDGLAFDYPGFKSVKVIKGDAKSPAIMAASIVAKVVRDRLMSYYAKQYPQYGFEKHKGYGTQAHLTALHKNGVCPIHRKTFEPVRSLIQ